MITQRLREIRAGLDPIAVLAEMRAAQTELGLRLIAAEKVAPLLSDDHLSVDGTLVDARAPFNSFRPKQSAHYAPPADGPAPPPAAQDAGQAADEGAEDGSGRYGDRRRQQRQRNWRDARKRGSTASSKGRPGQLCYRRLAANSTGASR